MALGAEGPVLPAEGLRVGVRSSTRGEPEWWKAFGDAAAGLASVVPLGERDGGTVDVMIDLQPGAPAADRRARRWTLVDAGDRLLDGAGAWEAASLAASGPRVVLLELASQGWRHLRDAHLATAGDPAADRRAGHEAVVRLLLQALRDLHLALAGAAGPVPLGRQVQVRAPRSEPPRLDRLAARWHRFAQRQRSRWLTEHWRIGIIDHPVQALLHPGLAPAIRWLTPPEQAGYWADPFGMPGDPGLLFSERYDEGSGVGRLQRMRLEGGGAIVEAEMAIGRGHASFPHVFEADGAVHAVAETCSDRECVLYRVQPGGRWAARATLLRGVAAADPAIVRWGHRWWLAFTDVDKGAWDNLCLYHAEHLEGPWQPHANNPVKTDVGGARMAGAFFEHAGRLYRPGQDCSRTYGGAVALYRVDEISPLRYRETLVRHVSPAQFDARLDGLHTMTAWGDRTLVDGKRLGFNVLALYHKLRRRLGTPRHRDAAPA